jgi:TM2 domain-containing membrane protein YozV
MPYVSRFCLICIFLCAPFISKAQIALGDSLSARGAFHQATIAYEYALFQGLAPKDIALVTLKTNTAYKLLGEYSKALALFDRVDFYSGTDSMRTVLYYQYIVSAMLANRYDMAWSKLVELRYELPGKISEEIILTFEILSLNELGRWQEAHLRFKEWAVLNSISADPYSEMLKHKMKDPDKAFALSYWLPGVGQMYAGHPGKGVVSSLLNAGLVAFSIYSFIGGYYLSGVFTGVALFYLSYNGGARYAQVLAEQYNAEKKREFNDQIRGIVVTGVKK